MKRIILFFTLLSISSSCFSQTSLSPGDIAITGFNADNDDEFTFVLLTDIENGTSINFTDNGWQTSGNFRPGNFEGIVTWVATTDLPCGTEINILSNEETVADTYTASIGTVTESEDGFALATNGDHILAYQGTIASPTFIFGIHFATSTGWTNAINSNTSAVPTGLTDGVTAVYVGNVDNSSYDCNVTSVQNLILAAITTPANWNGSNSRLANIGGCTYTCSDCLNSSTWDGTSWDNGTPNATTEAIINGNYNTGTNTSFNACSLTVNAGQTLVVSNGTFVNIEHDATINGTLSVQTQGNFVQNDNDGVFVNNGSSSVTKTTPIKTDWFYYTYWSSPVTNETIGNLFFDVDGDRRFLFNASNYIDADGDGIDDDKNDWQFALAADVMTPGVGYAITSSRQGTYPSSRTSAFSGAFNTGDITTPIVFNAANVNESWNFIGNPYPCAIDFDAFQTANNTVIGGAAYFWSQASPPDAANPGNSNINFNQNDYAIYASGMGSGTAGGSGVIPTQFIPSGQGFFVAGLTNANVTFTNAIRSATTTSNDLFFKSTLHKKNDSNKLWLNLTSTNGIFSQVLIGYVDGASRANNGLAYDAPRRVNPNSPAVLYSIIDKDSKKYAIQGRATTDLDTNEIINLGFSSTLNTGENYTLSIAQLEGHFLNNTPIFIKDNLTGVIHNLSLQDYSFTSTAGEFNDRFEIVFNANTFSTSQLNTEDTVSISKTPNGDLQFSTKTSTFKSIVIFDMSGKVTHRFKTTAKILNAKLNTLSTSLYIAQIELSNGYTVSKKISIE
jgi:hypothetical protein